MTLDELNWVIAQVNCNKSNYQMIKHVLKKLGKRNKKKFYALPRDTRRQFYQRCVDIHQSNVSFYYKVILGNF